MDYLAELGITPESNEFAPLSELNVVCNNPKVAEAYEKAVKHLTIEAKAARKKLRGTRVFYSFGFKPKKGPDDVLDFRTPRGEGGLMHIVHCRQGEAKLFLPFDHTFRYISSGIQVCKRDFNAEKIDFLRQAVELPGGLEEFLVNYLSAGHTSNEQSMRILRDVANYDLAIVAVAGVQVFYPHRLPMPAIQGNNVRFDQDGELVLYKNLVLRAPPDYDILFVTDSVILLPTGLGLFTLAGLKGRIVQCGRNRLARADQPGTEKYCIPNEEEPSTKMEEENEEPEQKMAVAVTDPGAGQQLPAVALVADASTTGSSNTAPEQLPQALTENSALAPQAPQQTDPASSRLYCVKQNPNRIEFPGASPIFFPHDLSIITLPHLIQLADGRGGYHEIEQPQGNIRIHFPTGYTLVPHLEGLEVMPTDQAESKMASATEKAESKMATAPEDVPRSDAGPVLDEVPPISAEALLAGEPIPVPLSPYPESEIELAGIKFMHPSFAVPIQTGDVAKLPGGLQLILKFKGEGGKIGELRLGDDWAAMTGKQGQYKIYPKSFPTMAAEKKPLQPIGKNVKQQFPHCGRCPKISTTYKEDRCVVKHDGEWLWFWFPPAFHPKLDDSTDPPKVVFPRSTAFFLLKGIEVHYPPNCDIIFTHEVHIYPKSARVIERYQNDIEERFFSPKPPQLIGEIHTKGNVRLIKLIIDPKEREALVKEEKDWVAGHNPAALAAYKKAEALTERNEKTLKSGNMMKRVRARVDDIEVQIDKMGDLSPVSRKAILMENVLDVWQEEYTAEWDKAEQKGEVSEEMAALIAHDEKWLNSMHASYQVMIDNIERLKLETADKDKKIEDEVATNINDCINNMFKQNGIPVEDGELGEVPRSSDYVYTGYENVPLYKTKEDTRQVIHPDTQRAVRLDEFANNFIESMVTEILGRRPAPPSLREDAPSLWI